MIGQVVFQKKLNDAFETSKEKNPFFSLRAFARKIELSPSAVSEIISGKRKVTRKVVVKVLKNLNLSEKEANEILTLFPEKGTTSSLPDSHFLTQNFSFDKEHMEEVNKILEETLIKLKSMQSDHGEKYKCLFLTIKSQD